MNGWMFFAPAASSISAAVSAMSEIMAFSFSPQAMLMRIAGMPKTSTASGSISMKFDSCGRHSPNPLRLSDAMPSRIASL